MAIFAPDIRIVGGSYAGARSSATSWCDYVMRQGQYHMKDGFDFSDVILPEHAPESWRNPYTLWNAVDLARKQINEQTGREFMIPIPRELNREQSIEFAMNWAEDNLACRGMVAHVVIHVDEDGSRHAHITATMRPLNKDGEFASKRSISYAVRRDGEEMYVSSGDWKAVKEDGWEKVYKFNDGTAWTKTEADERGYSWKADRVKDTCGKFKEVRIDTRAANWDDRANVYVWRKSMETAINAALDKYAPEAEHVDCRSYKARGIDRVPQVKQGAKVTELEKRERERCERDGIEYQPVTVVGAKNAEIEKINEHLENQELPRELKKELLDCGYELHADNGMIAPEQVCEHTRPVFERVREFIAGVISGVANTIKSIRETADLVLANPFCRTLASYAIEMGKRGVQVTRGSDLIYRKDGQRVTAKELGERYGEHRLSAEFGRRNVQKRNKGSHSRKNEMIRMEAEINRRIDFGYLGSGYLEIDAEVQSALIASAYERDELDEAIERIKSSRGFGSIADMGAIAEAGVDIDHASRSSGYDIGDDF